MTRPDKHAPRFGDRYQPAPDWRKLAKAMPDILAVMRRITEAFRHYADNMRRAREMQETARQVEAVFHGPGERWTYAPHIANVAAPTVAELEAGTPMPHIARTATEASLDVLLYGNAYIQPGSTDPNRWHGDILDRIDDTLLTYDSQHATGEQPWPYRGF